MGIGVCEYFGLQDRSVSILKANIMIIVVFNFFLHSFSKKIKFIYSILFCDNYSLTVSIFLFKYILFIIYEYLYIIIEQKKNIKNY